MSNTPSINAPIIGVPPLQNHHIIGVPPLNSHPRSPILYAQKAAGGHQDHIELSEEAHEAGAHGAAEAAAQGAAQGTAQGASQTNPFKFDPANNPLQLLSPVTSFLMDRLWQNRGTIPKFDPQQNPSQLFTAPLTRWIFDHLRQNLDNAH